MDFDLRPALDEDQEFLYELHCATMRSVVEQTWGWDEAWQRADFAKRFAKCDISIIEVETTPEAGARLVGSLWLEQRPDSLYIHELQILPELQGRGVGTAVVENVIEQGASSELPVALSVVQANPRPNDSVNDWGSR